MRQINEIILHCTDTDSNVNPEVIRNYHVNVLHWKDCGYHYLINNEGYITSMRPVSQVGAHCKGHNQHSIGIAYIGRTPSKWQMSAMRFLVRNLCKAYNITTVSRHCYYNSNKTCPNLTSKEYSYVTSDLSDIIIH